MTSAPTVVATVNDHRITKIERAKLVDAASRGECSTAAIAVADRLLVDGHATDAPALILNAKEAAETRAALEKRRSHEVSGIDLGMLADSVVQAHEHRLTAEFADELPGIYTPPDELVEGLLTIGDSSVWYGDSNTGKTFLVTDVAAAVARGALWMGRRTEAGLVVYLAAESPTSIQRRLQAYQRYHETVVPNFAIVKSPIDLYAADADTHAVVALVQRLEQQRGVKCHLIVGDTLARLSAGANENSGQDMGAVVKRIDHIRTSLNAHFATIHHSGKVAANGARGWSGIRAAIDTEIEVTDGPQGRCAEITKQRDLGSKGERVGFRLDTIELGFTKWGKPATSCVVVPADAPLKKSKRLGEVEGAIVEYLRNLGRSTKKAAVVKHFEGRYERGPVYRAIKALATVGAITEIVGVVGLAEAAK